MTGTHWVEHGHIIDVLLSDRRNAEAACTFFKQAIDAGGAIARYDRAPLG